MHVKDHLIPLPVRGEPDLMRLRIGGVLFTGPREQLDAVAGAIEAKVGAISGEAAVNEAHREEYRETWAPLLARKSLPGYLAERVPEWAREMYDAAEASDAVA